MYKSLRIPTCGCWGAFSWSKFAGDQSERGELINCPSHRGHDVKTSQGNLFLMLKPERKIFSKNFIKKILCNVMAKALNNNSYVRHGGGIC